MCMIFRKMSSDMRHACILYILLDMHSMSCMSIDINVERVNDICRRERACMFSAACILHVGCMSTRSCRCYPMALFTLWMLMSIDINVNPHASYMSLNLHAACIAHAERHADVARHSCCRSENTVLCIHTLVHSSRLPDLVWLLKCQMCVKRAANAIVISILLNLY